jgi:hypothetical protein
MGEFSQWWLLFTTFQGLLDLLLGQMRQMNGSYFTALANSIRAISRLNTSLILIVLTLIFSSSSSEAISKNPLKKRIMGDLNSGQIKIHNKLKTSPPKGLSLAPLTITETLSSTLKDIFKNPYVNYDPKSLPSSFSLTGSSQNSTKGGLVSGGVELCGVEVAAHKSWDGKEVLIGSVPYINPYTLPALSSNWPYLSDVLDNLRLHVKQATLHPVESILSYKKCHYVDDGWMIPAYEIALTNTYNSYKAYVGDERVFRLENLEYHADRNAKAVAYDVNANNAEVEQDIVVDTSGYLKNSTFQTFTNAVSKVQSVAEDRSGTEVHVFSVNDGDISKKGEVNAFTHLWKTYQYFQTLGYVNPDGLIDLELNVTINNSLNNAVYKPKESNATGRPRISLSTGDGDVLQNLSLDSDVVSHEFGHHTLWRSLKSTLGETLVLHEGLADFFTFTQQGDSCLGESICPANSNFCWYQGQCLRSADNTLVYMDDTYNTLEAHLKGQLVSGMLWDLHEDHSMALSDLADLTFEAVNLLSATSTLVDLILALNIADRNLNAGANLCTIKSAAESRGFGAHVNMDDCSPSSSWSTVSQTSTISSGGSTGSVTTSSSTEEDDGGLFGFCSISSKRASNNPLSIILLSLLLITPAILPFAGRAFAKK